MPRFQFRLEQVLRYRELMEESARDCYLEARAARLDAEQSLRSFEAARQNMITKGAATIPERIALALALSKQDELENQHRIALEVLIQEEQVRRSEWIDRKKDLQVLQKLRERELERWKLEERRREQREMDEFAVIGANR